MAAERPKNLCVIALLATLSACTSSTSLISTDTSFGLEQSQGAQTNLALSDASPVPEPAPRPAAPVAMAQLTEANEEDTLEDEVAATQELEPLAEPEPVQIAQASTNTQTDPATERILAANTAPTAGATIDASGAAPSASSPAPTPPSPIIETASTAAPVTANANRPGLLNALFAPRKPKAPVRSAAPVPAASAPANNQIAAPEPKVVVASVSSPRTTTALAGVDRDRALGIDTNPAPGPDVAPVQVASAAGLARLAPNGIRTQHSGVDVACLKPALVRVLKKVETKYGKPVVVTSGYRSPSRNASARGAKNSLHIYCAAADIQVEGVSKWDLASYLRSMPGRGGVGTYCHTKSVHIDIGPKRDWNWRCKRG